MSRDTTTYLLSSPANARRLLGSIRQYRVGQAKRRELIDPDFLNRMRAAAELADRRDGVLLSNLTDEELRDELWGES